MPELTFSGQMLSLNIANEPFFLWLFFTIRNHGSSSSIKFHVCHHVGGRRHTSVHGNGEGNPIPATITIDYNSKKNNQQYPHTSHCPSRPVTPKNNQKLLIPATIFYQQLLSLSGVGKSKHLLRGFQGKRFRESVGVR